MTLTEHYDTVVDDAPPLRSFAELDGHTKEVYSQLYADLKNSSILSILGKRRGEHTILITPSECVLGTFDRLKGRHKSRVVLDDIQACCTPTSLEELVRMACRDLAISLIDFEERRHQTTIERFVTYYAFRVMY